MANLETGLSILTVDADMVSMYPSIMTASNISRMTLAAVIFEIEGRSKLDIQDYFSNLITVRENAEYLCNKFHNLPSYSELRKIIADPVK